LSNLYISIYPHFFAQKQKWWFVTLKFEFNPGLSTNLNAKNSYAQTAKMKLKSPKKRRFPILLRVVDDV